MPASSSLNRLPALVALGLCLALAAPPPAWAALVWSWSYSGAGIAAGGTLNTTNTADAAGFYLITGITGTRNGAAITGLQPTGTPIPGNEPFAVDNLLSATGPQLTGNGFGFALADGTFANPFFADFTAPPGHVEFFSAPPFTGGPGPGDSELPVRFTAMVPEPATASLLALGLLGLAAARRRYRPRSFRQAASSSRFAGSVMG
jgi:hypothetical protein